MTIIRARYPGRDTYTGERFSAGTLINHDRWRKTTSIVQPGTAGYEQYAHLLDDADEADGRYIAARTSTGYVSDVFSIGGREYYRNKRGRCEDAPACGCCTI